MYWYQTGWVVLERVLAGELHLGQLTLKNVLVSPLPDGLTDTAAVVGLAAFANHLLVVDGPGGSVLIGEPSAPLVTPAYNRLGASFGPDSSARVASNSPAAEADIRDGDVLVAINGQTPDAYAATVDGHVWAQPAGTTVQLTLRRESEIIERRVSLRDFLTGSD
jgi:membrane-associated protease RseP (regulator of RpoE activity)